MSDIKTQDQKKFVLIITVVCFGLYYLLNEHQFYSIRSILNDTIKVLGVSHFIAYVIVGLPIYSAVFFLKNIDVNVRSFGLNKSVVKGLVFGFISTIPMCLGYAIFFTFNSSISFDKIIIIAVSASFFEEVYFRGFLFGFIFRKTNFGFVPSIIIGALIFASAHLYQSNEFSVSLGVFFVIFMGALLFAWLFVEWGYNLWVPIFVHLFMNLYWILFSVGDTALGGLYSNIFRIVTIVLMISITIRYKRKNKIPFIITKQNICMK